MSDARSIVKVYAEAEDFKRIDIIFEHPIHWCEEGSLNIAHTF